MLLVWRVGGHFLFSVARERRPTFPLFVVRHAANQLQNRENLAHFVVDFDV